MNYCQGCAALDLMRRLSIAATALLAFVAAPAGAATLTASGTLGIAFVSTRFGALPPVTIGGGPVAVFVSSGSGSFIEPASAFGPATVILPTQLFTGISLFSSLNVSVANGSMIATASGGIGGGFGGPGGLAGRAVVGILGGLINLNIPLSIVGAGGVLPPLPGPLMYTVTGHIWTTGVAIITGLETVVTPLGGFANTVTATGFDNRTAGHQGTILLVSPFRAVTNMLGSLAGFATQRLTFVPEPGTLLLIGLAIAGLALLGRKRMQK